MSKYSHFKGLNSLIPKYLLHREFIETMDILLFTNNKHMAGIGDFVKASLISWLLGGGVFFAIIIYLIFFRH